MCVQSVVELYGIGTTESVGMLTVADLFCGCGGFSYGFDYAGFEIVYTFLGVIG